MRRILTNRRPCSASLVPCRRSPHAQAWQPTRPIKMICPFPAGGGTDLIARIVAKQLSTTGSASRSMSRTAAAPTAALGAQEVMRAEPDGYTIGAISDWPMTVNPALYEQSAYVPLRDFIAVARINHFPSLLVAHPSYRIKTVADLIRLAKDKPGTLNYSSGGVGNFSHLGLAAARRSRPASTSCTCPIAASARRRQACSPATCSSSTTTSRPRCAHVRGRQAQRARRRRGASASPAPAGRPDHRRDRAGLRRHAVGRHVRAGQDAEGDRRAAQQGGRRRCSRIPAVVRYFADQQIKAARISTASVHQRDQERDR